MLCKDNAKNQKLKPQKLINKKAFLIMEGFRFIKNSDNYFLPSILSLSACNASLASPKVGLDSAA